jgi:hypothetical protein
MASCPICKKKMSEHSELQDKICNIISIKQFAITLLVMMFSLDLSSKNKIKYDYLGLWVYVDR